MKLAIPEHEFELLSPDVDGIVIMLEGLMNMNYAVEIIDFSNTLFEFVGPHWAGCS